METLCFLGLGSNKGSKAENLNTAINYIANIKDTKIISSSSTYVSEPVGMQNNEPFYNKVILIQTLLMPTDLIKTTQKIEKKMGRTGKGENLPRIIDIDILTYGDKIIKKDKLIIPHSKMTERLFVLLPLKELKTDWVHPKTKQTLDYYINIFHETQNIYKLGEKDA
ncbi:MAG: 2-amino-4-hydroxy-6-hydroxymethyldihydropteridine diphosphokinase [Elusimicrobiota bacterium]